MQQMYESNVKMIIWFLTFFHDKWVALSFISANKILFRALLRSKVIRLFLINQDL